MPAQPALDRRRRHRVDIRVGARGDEQIRDLDMTEVRKQYEELKAKAEQQQS